MRDAHGASVGAQGGFGVQFAGARQLQELLEFLTEEVTARWVIECQRGQRIKHPVTSGDAPKKSLYTENAEDDFRLHPAFHGNGVEQLAVLAPQTGAGVDALGVQEARAVFPPLQ